MALSKGSAKPGTCLNVGTIVRLCDLQAASGKVCNDRVAQVVACGGERLEVKLVISADGNTMQGMTMHVTPLNMRQVCSSCFKDNGELASALFRLQGVSVL